MRGRLMGATACAAQLCPDLWRSAVANCKLGEQPASSAGGQKLLEKEAGQSQLMCAQISFFLILSSLASGFLI